MAAGYYSVQWDGWVTPPSTGVYTFYVQSVAETGVRLIVGGQAVIAAWDAQAGTTQSAGSLPLQASSPSPLRLQYTTLAGGGQLQLLWSCPGSTPLQLVPSSAFSYADPVAGSPFTTTVTPASTQAASSSYTAAGGWVAGGGGGGDGHPARRVRQRADDGERVVRCSPPSSPSPPPPMPPPSPPPPPASTPPPSPPSLQGAGALQVMYRGAQVGAVMAGVVAVGPLSSAASTVLTPLAALTPLYAGVAQSAVVQTRDAAGNNLTTDVTVGVTPIALTVTLNSISPAGYSVACGHGYLGGGQYVLSYTVQVAGTYALSVQFGGASIAASPLTLTALPGLPSPAATVVSAYLGTTHGSLSTLTTLLTYDAYNNEEVAGGAAFVVRLQGAATLRGQVVDHGDGSYTVEYDPPSAGAYTGDVLLAWGGSAAAPGSGTGLTGTYFNNRWLTAPAAQVRVDAGLSFQWGNDSGLVAITPTARDYVSVQWTGYVRVDVPGAYTFTVAAGDGARLFVDSLTSPVIDHFPGPAGVWSAVVALGGYAAGTLVDVQLDYRHNVYVAYVQLNWSCAGCSPPVGNAVIPAGNLYPGATSVLPTPLAVTVT